MRFSRATALLLGSGALAQDLPTCFATKAINIAKEASCPDSPSLAECLIRTPGHSVAEIVQCLQDFDCLAADAQRDAEIIFSDCGGPDQAPPGDMAIGGKRSRLAASLPQQTPHVPVDPVVGAAHLASMPTPTAHIFERDGSLQCLITETVSTSTCSVETTGNRLKTISCFQTQVAKSRCAPGLMCSMDPTGADVCMKMHNTLDIGGIIISIIFGVAIVIGVSALTFMCCQERRYQKKLEARAEATALARAQTKKQRAEQRAPLMRQGGEGGGDPFHDRNRS